MEQEEIDYVRKYINEGNIFPDLVMSLDNILVPLACQSFEKLGIEIAKRIAHEYGAKVTLLHNGTRNLDKWAKPFEDWGIKITKKVTKRHDTAQAILDEAKNGYQLMIMPSRRRLRWIDKFLINSISAKIIPRVHFDVLQVFPSKGGLPGEEETIPQFKNVGILLPRGQRDPRLLFWANTLMQKDSHLTAYHIADLPRLTPMRDAMDTQVVIQENDQFTTLVKAYEAIFNTKIVPRFIISHKIATTAGNILNREKPDICVMGQSKTKKWYQIRTLSDIILDKANIPFIVHHQP